MFHTIDILEDINNIPLNFDKPYILKNNKMIAVKKWNLDYLKKQLNDKILKIEYYKTKKNFQQTHSTIVYKTFNEYISNIENGKCYYLAEYNLENLEDVLDKNDTLERFKFKRKCVEKDLYLGLNTYTNCHLHIFHDYVLNQVFGKKIVYMYDYYDNPSLEPFSIFHDKYNFIKDNFWDLDLSKYKVYKVVLEPGDCLLIPPWWYHAIKSIDMSCSITFIYKRTDLNYIKMGDIKLRFLYHEEKKPNIIVLYIIIYCILLYFNTK